MILGVNAPPTGWHDAAACLVDCDGALLAFCEEERLSRGKHARRQGPRAAVRYCLQRAAAQLGDVDLVAMGWNVALASRLYGRPWTLEQTPAWHGRRDRRLPPVGSRLPRARRRARRRPRDVVAPAVVGR